jgi:hypothetical protein
MMASSQSIRKNQTEKRRRGKLGLIDRADKVAMIGAKVLVILEINGKYSIYDSQPDKEWVPSNAILVRWKSPHVYLVKMLTDKIGAVLSTSRTVHLGRYPAAKGENETKTEDEGQAYRSNSVELTYEGLWDSLCILQARKQQLRVAKCSMWFSEAHEIRRVTARSKP